MEAIHRTIEKGTSSLEGGETRYCSGRSGVSICRRILCRCRSSVAREMRSRRAIWALLRPAANREKTSRSRPVRWILPKRDLPAPRDARSPCSSSSGAPVSKTTSSPRATDRIVSRKSLTEIPLSTNPDTPASFSSAIPERECAGCLPRCANFRCRGTFSLLANVFLSVVSTGRPSFHMGM
jgi:hypothetical protein